MTQSTVKVLKSVQRLMDSMAEIGELRRRLDSLEKRTACVPDPVVSYAAPEATPPALAKPRRREDPKDLYTPLPHVPFFDLAWLESLAIPQSMQFMVDCLPLIQRLTARWPSDKVLEVLDIGTCTGAGANLLATLYRGLMLGLQMKVDALDIQDTYQRYAEYHYPDINYIVADIFTYEPERKWDLVICSHTIEHFWDPHPFIAEVQRRARHWALFYAPFEEQHLLDGGKGHCISITNDFVQSLKPEVVEVTSSVAWRHPEDPVSRTVLFVLPGVERAAAG